ncbi:E3 ubiquitin-protein ligase TRIM39 [Silurus meridionalis]|nr:E3 ubiquitin-protein ligase TRIM39 [Silurus meridionalis]
MIATCHRHFETLQILKAKGLTENEQYKPPKHMMFELYLKAKKTQLGKTQKDVQQMIHDRLKKIQEIKHSVELNKRNTEKKKADSVEVFTALIRSIEKSQAELLKLMEEKQKAAEMQTEELIKELEQEVTVLQRRDTELEKLSHTEDHLHLLQVYSSMCSLPHTKNWTEISINTDLSGDTVRTSLSQLQQSLNEKLTKTINDKLKEAVTRDSRSLLSEEQLLCSICLDVFTDPVTTPCGHNFCKSCLTRCWEKSQDGYCPLCKEKFAKKPELKINTTLREVADHFKKKRVPDKPEVLCDVCTGEKLCTEGDHKNHNTVPIEEERRKRKRNTEKEKADSVKVFTALISSIETSQAELMELMEEKQKAAVMQTEELIKELEQEVTVLQGRDAEQEKLSHNEDHLHLLQVYLSMFSLPHTKNWTEISINTDLSGDTVRTSLSQLQQSLNEKLTKTINDKLKEAVNVILDPDTAHPKLILSADGKQVSHGDKRQNLPDTPERFNQCVCVLGKQSFPTGRFYYEVQVRGNTEWDLGVVRENINRKGKIIAIPQNGFWSVVLRNENQYKACADPSVLLTLREKVEKVGVFVDYEEGLVSFYDVNSRSHIYSFTGQTFTEKLYPFFSPFLNFGVARDSRSLLSEEQLLCPICLDVFTDHHSTPCGHNFCKSCLTKKITKKPKLKINTTLRKVADHFKKKSVPDKPEVLCDVCTGEKVKAVKSCLDCGLTFCKSHLEPHNHVLKLTKHKLINPVENLKDYICQKHERALELFCRDDQTCVCQFCTKGDHKNHNTVPIEKEIRERKRNTEKEKADSVEVFTALISSIEKSQAELLKLMEEKQKAAVMQAEELIKELEQEVTVLQRRDTEQEKLSHTEDHLHLLQIKEEFRRITTISLEETFMFKLDSYTPRLLQLMRPKRGAVGTRMRPLLNTVNESQSIENKRDAVLSCLIEYLGEPQEELFQDSQVYSSMFSLPHTKNWTEISINTDLSGDTVRTSLSQLQQSLNEKLTKTINDKLKDAVDVILDPDTAHPELILSADGKQVSPGNKRQNLPDTPERFNQCVCVLGKQSFSSGRFYYEVQVRGKTKWDLGVVRENINRKRKITLSPQNGFWSVILRNKNQYDACADPSVPLTLRKKVEKVGVFVDYEEGLVSFYNVNSRSLIYSFSGQTFTEKLYPYFSPCFNDGDPLILLTSSSFGDVLPQSSSFDDVSLPCSLESDVLPPELLLRRCLLPKSLFVSDILPLSSSDDDVSPLCSSNGDVTPLSSSDGDVSSLSTSVGDVSLTSSLEGHVSLPSYPEGNISLPSSPEGDISLPSSPDGDVSLPNSSVGNVSSKSSSNGGVSPLNSSGGDISLPSSSDEDVSASSLPKGESTAPGPSESEKTPQRRSPGDVQPLGSSPDKATPPSSS